jgi:2-keto-4-pentenoate hydratase/2-oxohepta-3-ene-1,7-dioic acid hydratase in catechol pathway
MRWVTYVSPVEGAERPGLLQGGLVHGLREPARLLDLLGDDDGERLAAAAGRALADPLEVVPESEARLRAPIPVPPSIRDFMAFEEHVANAGKARGRSVDPDWYRLPVFYFSNPACVHGPYDDVAIPPGSLWFDYELEIAAVIGRRGRNLAADEAEAHIAGYLILCDWSARDLQFREMRQLLGPAKGKDSATTFGPVLVTPDELADCRQGKAFDLAMMASVNGIPYSAGNLAALYWSFGEMIAYASRGTQVVPGDVIGSGTVGSGCILELAGLHGGERYPWLRPGDQVQLEVERLGAILARVVAGDAVVPLRAE